MKEVWVLWSVSGDKKFEIIRVYKTVDRGSNAQQMLQECGDPTKKYFLDLYKIEE